VIEIDPRPRTFAVAKVRDRPQGRSDRHATALPASFKPTEQKHTVTEIAVLVSDRVERLPRSVNLLEVPFNALASAIALALEGPWECWEPFEVQGDEIVIGVEIAAG
jgi:hypothetical protein